MKTLLSSVPGLFVVVSEPAFALDFGGVFAMQVAVEDHGFDAGKPDGRISPATRRALNGFAEKYGTDADPESVINCMMRQSLDARKEIENAEIPREIKVEVATSPRDPDSARFRNVYLVDQGGGIGMR